MTYRCTPHSGTELLDPSYLIFMFNRQIKNDFNLMRTKNPKIEYRNMEHQYKHCKAVFEYTEGKSVLFRNHISQNKSEIGIVKKKNWLICITLLDTMIKLLRNTRIKYSQITSIQNLTLELLECGCPFFC